MQGSRDFGLNVSKFREKKGISQMKLDELAGFPLKTSQRIESGADVKVSRVLPLCDALETSPNILFGYTNDPFSAIEPDLAEAFMLLAVNSRNLSSDKQKMLADMLKAQANIIR